MLIKKLLSLGLMLVGFIAVSLVSWGQNCSNGSFTGAYGFSLVGTDGAGNPQAAVGLFNADGAGKFTGTETISTNGGITSNLALRGVYRIAADCTGKVVLNTKVGQPIHLDLVVVSGGNTLRMVGTDDGEVLSVYAQAQGAATCSKAGLSGAYDFQGTGAVVGLGPVAFNGRLTLDGAGRLTGHESGSLAGSTFSAAPVFGGYRVAPNCAGEATFNVKGQPTSHISFVVVNGGQGVVLLQTDPGTVVPGSAQQ